MSTKSLIPGTRFFPSVFDDFFKPWNDWMDGDEKSLFSVPSVNVVEKENQFELSLAAPGLKKEDFKIQVDGQMLTISAEKEEEKEEKDEKYTRKEFNYSSFSRSFSLPQGAEVQKIEASYTDGLLKVLIPKSEAVKKMAARHVEVK